MATIQIYLDTRKTKNNPEKTAPLKLAINHRNKVTYLPLCISLLDNQWDKKKSKVKRNHPNEIYLNAFIAKRKSEAEMVILRLSEMNLLASMSANELRAQIDLALNGKKPEPDVKPKVDKNTFGIIFKRFMERKSGRTKGIYEATYNRISAWMTEEKMNRLKFDDIKIAWLEDFNDFLAKTCKANTIAIHMRNIRAVFNYAIDNEITTNYPFRRFKIKHEATRKRNFDIETLREIFNADVEPWMERYRDFFKLSFMLIGINTIDLCQASRIVGGRLDYIRSKTHKPYSIKVEPEALALIEKYKGKGQLLNYLDTVKHYRLFNNRLTYGLKKMKELLNDGRDDKIDTLSMYWARHSWATIAASLDIPKDTIAAALGHGGHSVTDIYIEFDMRKVDVANRKVLDWVLYGINPNEPKRRGRPRKA